MSNRRVASWSAVAAALALVIAVATPGVVVGQRAPSAAKAKAYAPPRMPDGHPSLQGYWTNITYTPLERPKELADKPFFTEKEAEEHFKNEAATAEDEEQVVHYRHTDFGLRPWQDGGKPNLRTSLIVDPPDGRLPPMTPEARQRAAARRAATKPLPETAADLGPAMNCVFNAGVGPMLPAIYNSGYLILQTPGYVTIVFEQNMEHRIIPLDGKPHLPQNIRQWLGDSRGHWEGDVLVVETTNFSEKRTFQGSDGTFLLVERLTRTSADAITYTFTVEDPTTWTKPWTAEVPLNRIEGPTIEYACNEGNVDEIATLQNARNQERGLIKPPIPERRANTLEEFEKKKDTVTKGVPSKP
jgi:hypothetical protein